MCSFHEFAMARDEGKPLAWMVILGVPCFAAMFDLIIEYTRRECFSNPIDWGQELDFFNRDVSILNVLRKRCRVEKVPAPVACEAEAVEAQPEGLRPRELNARALHGTGLRWGLGGSTETEESARQ